MRNTRSRKWGIELAREQIEQLVANLVGNIITNTGLELVDVEYVKERDWYLRVFLDKLGGIEVEDCQWVSEKLESELDRLDPIRDSYYLEISSPGLDRPLKKEADFTRYRGETVDVHMFAPLDGRKMFTGTLLGLNDGNITINMDGTETSIAQEKVSQVRLHIDF